MLRDGDLQLVGCETARFQVVDGEPLILNLLEALTKNKVAKMQLAKMLANPTLVTVSGRPASFRVGGEVPAVVAEPGGCCRVAQREIGLRVDVVAVTRNDGKIRLELRPCIRELDAANSLPDHPIIKSRSMDTEVELAPGQTLVMSGMVEDRVVANQVGIPWLADVPYLGRLFSRVEEHVDETEVIMLAKAELVDALDPDEIPEGPGFRTVSPCDYQLYWKGYADTPARCPEDGCQANPPEFPVPSSAQQLPLPETAK
jgi:pilus assembly protein CpaC